MILFGVSPIELDLIAETWQKGFVTLSEMNPERAAYTASYTVKKWTKETNPALAGRPPEFSLQSRKPAIGMPGLLHIADSYRTRSGCSVLAEGIIGNSLRYDSKVYPLGRTMMTKLKEELGLPSNFGSGPTILNTLSDGEVQKNKAKADRTARNYEKRRKQYGL